MAQTLQIDAYCLSGFTCCLLLLLSLLLVVLLVLLMVLLMVKPTVQTPIKALIGAVLPVPILSLVENLHFETF